MGRVYGNCKPGRVSPASPRHLNNAGEQLPPPVTTYSRSVRVAGAWKLHRLPLSTGATCLDGSQAGFYYFASPSTTLFKDSWVFFFEGGGWCVNEEDCAERAKTSRGSSHSWENTTSIGGILNRCCYFTRFCQFNRVYVKSCDGMGFAGNGRSTGVDAAFPQPQSATQVISAGQAIVTATLDALTASYGLAKNPVDMLVAGCSAGGRAALLYAPAIRRILMSKGVTFRRFKVMSMAGIFFPHVAAPTVHSHRRGGLGLKYHAATDRVLTPFSEHMRSIAQTSDMTMGSLATTGMAKCRANLPSREAWRCSWGLEPVELMPDAIPVFLVQSVFDLWQTSCILAAAPSPVFQGGCSEAAGWRGCIPWGQPIKASQTFKGVCTSDQLERMNAFQQSNLALLAQSPALRRPGYGGFFHGCNDHCTTSDAVVRLSLNNVSLRDATQKWCASLTI